MDKVNATFERLNATGSHLVGKIWFFPELVEQSHFFKPESFGS